jgi:hypothetical protein
MNDSDGKLRKSNAGRKVHSQDHAHEISDGNEDSIGNLTREHDAILWQRICVNFVQALRLCGRLNLKMMY